MDEADFPPSQRPPSSLHIADAFEDDVDTEWQSITDKTIGLCLFVGTMFLIAAPAVLFTVSGWFMLITGVLLEAAPLYVIFYVPQVHRRYSEALDDTCQGPLWDASVRAFYLSLMLTGLIMMPISLELGRQNPDIFWMTALMGCMILWSGYTLYVKARAAQFMARLR